MNVRVRLLRPTTTVLLALAAWGLAAAPLAAQQQPPTRIAVLDLDAVLEESAAGSKLRTALDSFLETAQNEMKAKAERVQSLQKKVTDGSATLPANELASLEKEFQTAAQNFRDYQDQQQRAGQKLQADGLREIEEKLQPIFQQIRDAEGYDLIINNAPGVVMIASPRVDITKQVIAQLDASTAKP